MDSITSSQTESSVPMLSPQSGSISVSEETSTHTSCKMLIDTVERLFVHDGVIKFFEFKKWDQHLFLKIIGYILGFLIRGFLIVVVDGSLLVLSRNGLANLDPILSNHGQRILMILTFCIGNIGAVASAMGNVWTEAKTKRERDEAKRERDEAKRERDEAKRERKLAARRHNEIVSMLSSNNLSSTEVSMAVKSHNARLRKEIVNDIAHNILQLDVSNRYDTADIVTERELQQRPLSNETNV